MDQLLAVKVHCQSLHFLIRQVHLLVQDLNAQLNAPQGVLAYFLPKQLQHLLMHEAHF